MGGRELQRVLPESPETSDDLPSEFYSEAAESSRSSFFRSAHQTNLAGSGFADHAADQAASLCERRHPGHRTPHILNSTEPPAARRDRMSSIYPMVHYVS